MIRKQSTTTYPIKFLMVDSSDHVTGKASLTPTVLISKNGDTFISASGAVSELESGWYLWAGNATDRATIGDLSVHVTASGADPADFNVMIVDFDPFVQATALSCLDAAISGVDDAVWGASSRTLTQAASTIASTYNAGEITAHRGDTLSAAITGLGDLTGYTKIWFTVKKATGDNDTDSIIQIDLDSDSSGMLYLNGDTYADTAGAISIDSTTAGNITVTVQPDATALLNVCKGYPFDVQMLTASAVTTMGTGTFNVTGDVTRAVS